MEGINMNEVIKISNLNKSFGDVHAVNDLSFMVKKYCKHGLTVLLYL